MRLGKKKKKKEIFFEYKNVNLSLAPPSTVQKNKNNFKYQIEKQTRMERTPPPSSKKSINPIRTHSDWSVKHTPASGQSSHSASLFAFFSFSPEYCVCLCVCVCGGGMRVDGGGKVR